MMTTNCVWSDIAQIEKGYEEPVRNEMYYDGERALGILIAASSGSDIVKVGYAVEARLAELKAERRLPGSNIKRYSTNRSVWASHWVHLSST